MVRDTDNAKIADEEQEKKPSERVNPRDNDLESSRGKTKADDILHVLQNSSRLNLTLRYLAAIMVVVIAFWLYYFITSILGPGLPTYILFYPAVIIVALLAGFGPGLVATITSVILVVNWILQPQGQLLITTTVDQVGVVLFTGFGILISGVSELYRRNRIKAAAYDREKAVRETLREKEFLANILEESSQPFAIGYLDGRLGLLNHAFEQLTGYTKEELRTIDWSNILTPVEWREMEKQKLDELHRTGQPVRYEKEYIRKDGSIVPIELLVNIFLDKEGNPEYYYSFITDITERKRAEEDLKRQAALLDLSYEAIFSWDYNGGITSWNQGAERLYGYTSNEAIGHISHDLLKTKFHKEFTDYIQLLYEDKMWTGELTHTTKDGKEIIVESRQQIIKDASNKNIVIESNRDITKRKIVDKHNQELLENEQQLTEELQSSNEELQATTEKLLTQTEELKFVNRELVKSTKLLSAIYELNPDAIVLTTLSDSKIIDCNQEYLNQIGYSREETIGHTSKELNLISEVTREAYIDKTRGNNKVSNIEVKGRRKDGSSIDLLYSTRKITVDNEDMVLNIGHDMTEIKKAEKEIIKTMDELKRSNQELERFAYVSSHDLQEPLRMVTLYSQLLERRYKDSLDSDADDFIEYIVENAKRMKQLIDDLLEYSRVTSQAREFVNVDLTRILDVVLSNLSIIIMENNAKVNHDSLPTVFADENQMMRVFQNLITNAIKFRGDKPPEINISSLKGEKEWIFSVSDNGIGIKPEHQKQIFEVFKRLHTREEYPGTGIGLSIVQKIIRHHDGRIWVESEPGNGTTFYFTIPFSEKSPFTEWF
jgi:PAS domain S-box-containing protein